MAFNIIKTYIKYQFPDAEGRCMVHRYIYDLVKERSGGLGKHVKKMGE